MRILHLIWRVLRGVKDALVLLLLLLFFGVLYAALQFRPTTPVPTSGALVIALNGGLVDELAEVDPRELLTGTAARRDLRLRDLIRAMDAAARDGRVKALVLDLDGFEGGGQSAIAELGQAVERLKRAGKPVLAFARGYDDNGYQLAAHASEIWIDPLGAVLLIGPGGSQPYFKGLLDRIGVTANIYRVGTYKAAVEPFSRTDQSAPARAAAQDLVGSIWRLWRAEVAAARPGARLDAYIADPVTAAAATRGDMAEAARAARLVDRVGGRVEFGRRVALVAGAGDARRPGDFQRIGLSTWLAGLPATTGDAVGVLTVAGTIVDGDGGPGLAGGDEIARRLNDALTTNAFKALVVRIDSPGGSVTGSEAIRAAIQGARDRGLPVVASFGPVAASGGYWVATASDRILAGPSTITGSIGVFAVLPSFERALAKIGITTDGVRATPLSGEPDLLAGPSDAADRLLQAGVEGTYARFLRLVATARRTSPQAIDAVGQGRVWTGEQALARGLIDGFGNEAQAVAAAATLAKLDPATVRAVPIERGPDPFQWLYHAFGGGTPADGAESASAGGVPDVYTRLGRRPATAIAAGLGEARAVLAGPAIQVRCLECGADRAMVTAADRTLLRLLLDRIGG